MKTCQVRSHLTTKWVVVLFLVFAGPVLADSLTWRQNENKVDADIASWKVVEVLEHVAKATGWKVYVDPGAADRKVNTRFKDRPADKALDLLLGSLNRVLLPPTNGGSPRLLVFRNFEKEATRLVRARIPKHLRKELIVQLRRGAKIEDLAKQLGARIVGRDDELNAYRLEFDTEEAANAARETLKDHEDVASVDLNYPIYRDPEMDPASANAALNLNPKADPNCDHVIIGLIDTALHPQGGAIDQFLLPSISVAGQTQLDGERPSHGDAMSQTALRGTSFVLTGSEGARVRIQPVDVYGNKAETSTFEVAAGINAAINKGAMVINMSLGSPGGTAMLEQVIKRGHEQGVIFLGAAGNEPVDTPTFPAAYPEVIAVTAGDPRGNVASYANRGDFVDVMVPGTSTVLFNNQAWRVAGTSAASALAAGMAAGLAQQNLPCSGGSAANVAHWRRVEQAIRKNLAVKAPQTQ